MYIHKAPIWSSAVQITLLHGKPLVVFRFKTRPSLMRLTPLFMVEVQIAAS